MQEPLVNSFLLQSVTTLAGVGEKIAKTLAQRIGPRLIDLLYHFPLRFEARHWHDTLSTLYVGEMATFVAEVYEHKKTRRQYVITCGDDSGVIQLIYFHRQTGYLERLLPVGRRCLISGKIDHFRGQWQIIHPDHIGRPDDRERWTGEKPLYPLVAGVGQKQMQQFLQQILARLHPFPEWIPASLIKQYGWRSWHESMRLVHGIQPSSYQERTQALERLAFDELYAHQCALGIMRYHHQKQAGIAFTQPSPSGNCLQERLPYTLTKGQEDALKVITQDMTGAHRMLSLLMGDVGSGKTIVALFTMLKAIDNGYQAAFLAPTEILATQHYETIKKLLEGFDIKIGLFVGKNTKKQRLVLEESLKRGHIHLAIGTHALLEEGVAFHQLGLVVIDEQHRFGVAQRVRLIEKGGAVDVLVMSATPIPRTMLLTLYGELKVLKLTDKPEGRQPIATRVLSKERLTEVYERLHHVINKGERVYWICPLIDESEVLNLSHTEERFEALQQHFKDKVGLVHGRMSANEKEAIMQDFREGTISILVATTVVEVGVDVPEATVIVIEHAERFGLAQLHQLRGRVGRGTKASTCLLLYDDPLSETGKKRLQVMRACSDGFVIAEEDLKLRGGGDVLGLKQSGMPTFKVANPYEHMNLLKQAHQTAEMLLKEDLYLTTVQGEAVRVLLSLYEHNTAMQTLKSG